MASERCASCGKRLAAGITFQFQEPDGVAVKCLRCALVHGPMLRRSVLIALVVGTILTAINQGDLLFGGRLGAELLWKIPLTYAVPFCVATWSGLLNRRG